MSFPNQDLKEMVRSMAREQLEQQPPCYGCGSRDCDRAFIAVAKRDTAEIYVYPLCANEECGRKAEQLYLVRLV